MRAEALAFLGKLAPKGSFADWRSAQLDSGQQLADAAGRPAVWVFRVLESGTYAGYMTVDAHANRSPVLEYSRNPAPVFPTTSSAQRSITAVLGSAGVVRQVYLGPLDYRVEALRRGGSVALIPTGALRGGSATATVETTRAAQASLGTTSLWLSNVPDFDQFSYDYTSFEYNNLSVPSVSDEYSGPPYLDTGTYYSGCTPTAASNIVWYWSQYGGFPRLVSGALPLFAPEFDPDSADPYSPDQSARQKVVNDMHVAMHTQIFDDGQGDYAGSTYASDAGPGMETYASQVGGYSFNSVDEGDFAWNQYVAQLSAGHPVLLLFQGLDVENGVNGDDLAYGNHAITGVGYDYTPGDPYSEYMLIYDNWQSTPDPVYVEYNGADDSWWSDEMVTFAPSAPPSNDSFSSAQTLSGASGNVPGMNALATFENGEPRSIDTSPTGAAQVGASVWYRWTAPFTGRAAFDTFGSSFDTVLGVYTGPNVGLLTPVGGNDDCRAMQTSDSRVVFSAVAGTTYYVCVDGYQYADAPASTGAFELDWGRAAVVGISAPTTCPHGFVTLGGSLASDEGASLGGRTVNLQAWDGSSWVDVDSVDSGSGVFSDTSNPTGAQSYRWLFAGDNIYSPMGSDAVTVYPAALVGRPSTPSSVKRNKSFTIKGSLDPWHQPGARAVVLYCYRHEGKKWKLRSRFWANGTGGGYKTSTKLGLKGSWRIQAFHPADQENSAAWSTTRSLTVK